MSPFMQLEAQPQVTLPWLVRLRWLAVAGQILAVIVAWALRLELSFWTLGALVGLAALSNLLLATVASPAARRWGEARLLGSVMTFDTLLLTALLAGSGGPMNPFTVFYLVHITLSAVVLSARWAALVAALSFAGFGVLFLLPGAEHAHHAAGLGYHLQGMWVAFVLAAGLTTFFVRQITRAIERQRAQIAALREASARSARLAAITTLAAGAAHELGSPLGTIAIAAHDARLALDQGSELGSVADDLQLISLEVDRCQEILSLMAARASSSGDDAAGTPLAELLRSVRAQLGEERSARVEFRIEDDAATLELPLGQTTQSVVALIRNGLEASPGTSPIRVVVTQRGAEAQISVEDRGSGIPAPLLPRVGEPFFTTKQPGRGLGLGVFLVRAFVESRGGELIIESTLGVGTSARMRIPLGASLEVVGS
ncbi:MAG: hypothetical protein RL685_6212 [Pseudomonadota bacterium]|jgi:two-component system sensor histidine kinase RegB